jgi:hypothetical protein
MKKVTILVLTSFLAAVPCLAQDAFDDNATATWDSPVPQSGPNWNEPTRVLYDNGPLITHYGTGFGGCDESVLQSVSLGMNTLGFGHQVFYDNVIADDFTIPEGETWCIGTIEFFAYQTGSSQNSTMTQVFVQIREGTIDGPVVFGDLATNRMIATGFTCIYRVSETTSGASSRPIMAQTCDVPITLGPGTYWIEWQTDGTLSSGPWAPPITILGQATTGNGLQSLDGGVTYGPALDSGTSTQQGFPFIITDGGATGTEEKSWGKVKSEFK